METILKFFLVLISVAPTLAAGQKLSSAEADSAFSYFKTNPPEDYRSSLRTGLGLKSHFLSLDDTCKAAQLSTRLAKCFERIGHLDSALQELHSTEQISLNCDPRLYIQNLRGQTGIYIELEYWDQVIKLADKAEEIAGTSATDSAYNEMLVNKAIALVYMGELAEAKSVFRSYYRKAMQSEDYEDQLTALSNLGALAGYTEDLDSAEYYLSRALKICGEYPCANMLEILQNLATLASFKNDYALSKFYLDSAMSTAIRQNDLRTEAALHRELAGCLRGLGRLDEALDHMFDHSNLKDTVNKREIIERVAEYQELFESEEKNRKIKELELEKLNAEYREISLKQTRNMVLVAGLGILLLAIGLWSRLRYIKRTNVIINREKERSDELLLNILPFEVAEELKTTGASEAKSFDDVTVIFTDFMDFTRTAEQLSAKDLVDEINMCFKQFDTIIQDYSIEKIKTIGDAYMAAGGLHSPRTSDTNDVVKAALEMQAFMLNRKKERSEKGLPAFDMRVGIHTGPVVAGIVGVKKFQYDIWGDTVNTASRMESHGTAGKVNISDDTYGLIKDDPQFTFESRGKVEVKGKGELEMYFVAKSEK